MSEGKEKVKKRSWKTPATTEKGYKIVEEFKFVAVYEYVSKKNPNAQWWVIEDKLYANVPVRKAPNVPILGNMYWEQGLVNGQPVEIRSYFPKNHYEKEKVLEMAFKDNHSLEKEYKKLQKFRQQPQ